ncbi:MAG TPA: YciI family protein [Polyangiales bacterium]|nr:YciI family protein [Polyangiales bacterium]
MMLLKSDANAEAGVMPDEKLLTDMGNYNQRMVEAGVMVGGEGLHPSSQGVRVRTAKGKTTVIDGPFAESKELVAGYFMLQTKSLAEAIEWAKQIPEPPGAQGEGEIELRPLFETEDFPVDAAEKPEGWREKETEFRAEPPVATPDKGARWIALLKADKNTEAGVLPSQQVLQEMGDLMGDMVQKGVLIGGEGLQPSAKSAKLRIAAGGKRTVIDGPFSESKELIAGFITYRAKSKAEAAEWARRWLDIHVRGTGSDQGEIEVRRVFETEEIPVTEQEQAGGWRDQEKRLRERLGQ